MTTQPAGVTNTDYKIDRPLMPCKFNQDGSPLQPAGQPTLEGGDSTGSTSVHRRSATDAPVIPSNPASRAAGQPTEALKARCIEQLEARSQHPTEARVEQRHRELAKEICWSSHFCSETNLKHQENAAYSIATSEARAVDAATKELRAEIELLEMQAAACMTACFQNTEQSSRARIDRSNPYWTQAYDDVCKTVDREMKHRNEAALLQTQLAQAEAALREARAEVHDRRFSDQWYDVKHMLPLNKSEGSDHNYVLCAWLIGDKVHDMRTCFCGENGVFYISPDNPVRTEPHWWRELPWYQFDQNAAMSQQPGGAL